MKLIQEQLEELKMMITQALNHLYRNDMSLITRKAHERSIAFKFGQYFSKLIELSSFSQLKDIHLDMEYNRDINNPKKTPKFPNGIVPDLLLHKREQYDKDFLVIEFKTYWNSNNEKSRTIVENKLKELTSPDNQYKFQLGVLICFNENLEKALVEYYAFGMKEKDYKNLKK
jgi:hypothetical protein